MGTYISQSDVEDVFGATNVQKWSDLENAGATDTDRVAAAIAWAEAYVEGRFRRRRYAVPFVGTEPMLTHWMAVLAGEWLYKARGLRDAGADNDPADRVVALGQRVRDDINAALAGQLHLNLEETESTGPSAPAVVA